MGVNKTDLKMDKEKATDQETNSGNSLRPLHSVKPSANISILDGELQNSEERVQKVHEEVCEEAIPKIKSEAKVETFFEKPLEPSLSENKKLVENLELKSEVGPPDTDIKADQPAPSAKPSEELPKEKASEKALPTALERKPRVGSAASGLLPSEKIFRNQSDIFSLKEQTSIASAIFSVNGSPSRKVYRRKEVPVSNVFPFGHIVAKEDPPSEKASSASPRDKIKTAKESYHDLKRSSNTARNPLTGTGLSSNDEYKFKGTKRKDGNPLLGLGYSPEATPSAHRIPPGGFSHQLW